ncbi:uncharacterized protein LOC126378282 [Pectinophora gossypiella]|uniref:uncharacterized protein LOC126378282 n=1 Tax=Pectinophora gossypiella TaxID=13191 RepID=UPI00214E9F95|nr:uncharacterized protein LOC126378282 [Pectinophora gossypiella]
MYKRHLTSIPEKNESEEDARVNKWVPKKKHEVLKAKYKCLKKLFQIYDASVIGILPETYEQDDNYTNTQSVEERPHSRRKRRSHRTKTDACAGTTESSSGDVSVRSEDKEGSIASAVIRDLKVQCSCSTQITAEKSVKCSPLEVQPSSMCTDHEFNPGADMLQQLQHPVPYLCINEHRNKPTRFQLFLQRLFGLRREKPRNYVLPNGHIYAASDNNIAHDYCERRRRRGLRIRRFRKPKKIHSESALRDLKTPTILSCVQSVQRNCLIDRTPRQCPIVGCKMMFYGIINYNDHLNLCHFTDRKYVCHYCHEGFELEYDKTLHENEHLGISKLNQSQVHASATSTQRQSQRVSNTQTEPELKCDVPEEKLKKIVSFFDKLVDTEQMLSEFKKSRYSESNLHSLQDSSKAETETVTECGTVSSDKRTASCSELMPRKADKSKTTAFSDLTSKCSCSPVKCHICGEDFDYRRQLSLHVDVEHGVHEKFSKFHSCAGITDWRRRRSELVKAEAGKINVQSVREVRRVNTNSTLTPDTDASQVSGRKSVETLSCDPSTNIIYYESMETVKKPSIINNFVEKVKSGITSYRWEPGTTIIRV